MGAIPIGLFVITFYLAQNAGPPKREILDHKKGWYIRTAVLI
jgi:hypothetical protein